MKVDLTCRICNKQFDTFKALSNHITRHHKMTCKLYYDKYYKTEDEGICLVSFVDSKTFLEKNHIQGSCVSSIRYGLYYEDELVSLMTFGKSRFKSNEYELLRFCNKLNTTVVGGASKLFKHFLREHSEITTIVSYADRCWSIGNLYEKLGFTKHHNTAPNYYYIGQDINETHVSESKQIIKDFNLNATVECKDIFTSTGEYECLFTCSPYSLKEVWNNNETDKTCDEWIDECMKRFKCKRYVFVVDNIEKYKDKIVETISNNSHFGINNEYVVVI